MTWMRWLLQERVFCVLDTSKSMEGLPIEELNNALQDVLTHLAKESREWEESWINSRLDVMLLQTGKGDRCFMEGHFAEVRDCLRNLDELTAEGTADYETALTSIEKKLDGGPSTKMGPEPLIIFTSKSKAVDTWKPTLEKLKKNRIYQQADKIGIAIGEEADKEFLLEAVGNPEAVCTIIQGECSTGSIVKLIEKCITGRVISHADFRDDAPLSKHRDWNYYILKPDEDHPQGGTEIQVRRGGSVCIGEPLTGGGNRWIFPTEYDHQTYMLIWYNRFAFGKNSEKVYKDIQTKITYGAPHSEFFWPVDITEWINGGFGVMVPEFPREYVGLDDIVSNGKMYRFFKSFKAVIDIMLRIVLAFSHLHDCGYCCQGMNLNSIFVNPHTGRILIADYKNFLREGLPLNELGELGYTAPEIVTGKADPSGQTDRFSMAVILFILLTATHPFKGKRYMKSGLTWDDKHTLFGSDPLFIMDPDNDDNGPDSVAHASVLQIWPCLPDYIKQIFLRVFSQEALQNPMTRPTELDWMRALTRFRSDIVQCPACGNEVFTQDGRSCRCDACRKMVNIPFRLELEDYSIPAVRNSRIYRCQLGICNESEALSPVAQVVEKVDQPGIYGLRNRSGHRWDAVTSKGATCKVGANEVMPIKAGIQLKMLDETVVIRENSTDICRE